MHACTPFVSLATLRIPLPAQLLSGILNFPLPCTRTRCIRHFAPTYKQSTLHIRYLQLPLSELLPRHRLSRCRRSFDAFSSTTARLTASFDLSRTRQGSASPFGYPEPSSLPGKPTHAQRPIRRQQIQAPENCRHGHHAHHR
jgi:hypothetical protein